ncbi:hypothetical protein ABEB36_001318 [Hypothenemus hampei]|uniref:Uncharacterized protein n=1 Tax=Hypothenemus hampei TaxID=57062 RepID=A0ABD1FE68_HYPHA
MTIPERYATALTLRNKQYTKIRVVTRRSSHCQPTKKQQQQLLPTTYISTAREARLSSYNGAGRRARLTEAAFIYMFYLVRVVFEPHPITLNYVLCSNMT